MRKITTILSVMFLTSLTSIMTSNAQEHLPITLSGFTEDVIANGQGTALGSITSDVDGVNYALVSKDYQLTASSATPTHALPLDGKIETSTRSFQLADYSSNNSLRLEGANQTGTLTFNTYKKAIDVYVLGVSGSGSSTISAVVNFDDNTTETFSGITYPDWYSTVGNIVTSQVGRINTTNNGLENGPQLFEGILNISLTNQAKEIESITFTTTSGSGSYVMNILAISINPVLEDCIGAPNAGNANNMQVCANQNFTLSTDNPSSPANGLQRIWQESPSGLNTWTNIIGADQSTYIVTGGITTPMDYRLIMTCSFSNISDTSDVIVTTLTPSNACYCIPQATNSSNYINNFSTTGGIQNISNTGTGFSTGGYGDFTTMVVEQDALGTVNFSADVAGGTAGFRIWVDWNQNGIFDANEVVYHSTSYAANHSGSFDVPVTAAGGTTRMRIVSHWLNSSGDIPPCTTGFTYGEFEDYTFEVISAFSCTGTPTAGTITGPTTICATVPFDIEMDAPILEADITYQWQSSPSGTNTWANITGATLSNYTATNGITTATDYRLIVTCTNSSLSDTTATLSLTMSPGSSCYCEPIHTYGCISGAHVGGVTTTLGLTNISNTNTGCGSLTSIAYSDYSATHSASAAHSNLMNIKVDVSNYAGGVKIWIDWNQNGIFEANELVGESASTISSGNFYQTNFTVPSTATVGATKMRVRVVESTTTFDACSTQSYGEAEDYEFVVIQGTPCTGMPSIDTIQGPNEICALTPFAMSMTPIMETDISYVWQSSPAGTNAWATITGASQAAYTVTNGISTATDYRLIVTCTNSNLSDTTDVHAVTMAPGTSCYCEPSYTFGCSSDNINNFILAGEIAPGINNLNTPCPPTGYHDYSPTMSASLLPGNTYSGNVTTNYSSASENVRIWIDYNQNGIFEASETVATLANLSNSSTGAFSFTVPPTTAGGTYKMRVRLVYAAAPLNIDPCSIESFGETHDYTILIDGLCTDPIVDLGPDVTICEGESITLDAGNAGLDFEWNDNSTGQTLEVSTSGTYYVTVTDDDCSTTDSVVVTVQDLPIVDLGADVTICEGESTTLDAGNPGASYLWSNNSTGQTLNVTAEGTYSVTVTQGTCFASDTVAVSYIDAPTADGIIANEQDDCFYTFSVDNAQNVVYYEWDFGDGSPATIGAAVNYNYPQSGTYDVTLNMVSSCGDTLTLTKVVKCDNGIGIEDVIADKNAVTLYPNPTTDLVTIESENNLSMKQVTVYNVLGQKVYQNAPMSQFKHTVDVSKMASGVYTIHVQTNNGVIIRKFEIIK